MMQSHGPHERTNTRSSWLADEKRKLLDVCVCASKARLRTKEAAHCCRFQPPRWLDLSTADGKLSVIRSALLPPKRAAAATATLATGRLPPSAGKDTQTELERAEAGPARSPANKAERAQCAHSGAHSDCAPAGGSPASSCCASLAFSIDILPQLPSGALPSPGRSSRPSLDSA